MFKLKGTSTTDIAALIERVKSEVDCQLLIPDDGTREDFGRYVRQSCINPEHTDSVPTMLIFHDGWNCPACGEKGDAIDVYRMWHPDAGVMEACDELLNNSELKLDGEAVSREGRNERVLDPDLPIKYHFALAEKPEAVAGLMKMGFTKETIRHFKLGWARVKARLEPGTDIAGLEDAELVDIRGQQVAFQWQWRYSVPIFIDGRLRQIIYRKSADDQLGGKTTMEKDAGSHLFGQDELVTAGSVAIVEGWGDKLIWHQWGFRPEKGWAVVTSTNGAGHWNSDWNELLGNARRVFVGADADNAGSKMMKRVKADIPWAVPLTLPWPHGTKKDWRDGWLAGWQRPDVDKLIKQAQVAAAWTVVAGGKR